MSFPSRLLLILAFTLFSGWSRCADVVGLNINYTFAGVGSTYLVRVNVYRDCAGTNMPPNVTVCYHSNSCAVDGVVTLPLIPNGTLQIPPCPYLPNTASTCQGGTGYGFEIYVYEAILSLPVPCTDWELSCSPTFDSKQFYCATTLDNLNYETNSSPFMPNLLSFIFCQDQPAWLDYHCVDLDNDSISYHIVPFESDTNVCLPNVFQQFNSPYNYISSSTPVMLDPVGGILTFTPDSVQYVLHAIEVDEYRNGVHLSHQNMENAIYVVNSCVITGLQQVPDVNKSVSPNPFSNEISIPLSDKLGAGVELTVRNSSGRLILKTELTTGPLPQSITTLQTTGWSGGMYTISVRYTGGVEVFKGIKLEQ